MIEFTHAWYCNLLQLLIKNGYTITSNYNNSFEKECVLCHDVDFSLSKALEMAKVESRERVTSTYFILLDTNFYNIYAYESRQIIDNIINLGHEVGLHFDEKPYEHLNDDELSNVIEKEMYLLSNIIGCKVSTVSMHRPKRDLSSLKDELKSKVYNYHNIHKFKYFSDSRMSWKVDIEDTINSTAYNKINLLTHPFWYGNNIQNTKEKLFEFIMHSKLERYHHLKNNFRMLDEVVNYNEVCNDYN